MARRRIEKRKERQMIYCGTYPSSLGLLTMASDGESLLGLWMETQSYFPSAVDEPIVNQEDLPLFLQTKEWLDRYFAGEKPVASDLPLAPEGSEFRKAVWRILCEIPYGELMTYGDIAKAIALAQGKDKMSARAVGGAIGHNPISIIIPCHRVIGAKNNLTGYTGGLDKKIWLLTHEGIDMEKMIVPSSSKERTK